MSVKNNLRKAHEKRLFHSSSRREGGRRAKEEDREKSEKKREAAVNRREGWSWRWRGERGWGLRNADPFPRWPLWTISLPTPGP